jgi:hypothetical protein
MVTPPRGGLWKPPGNKSRLLAGRAKRYPLVDTVTGSKGSTCNHALTGLKGT